MLPSGLLGFNFVPELQQLRENTIETLGRTRWAWVWDACGGRLWHDAGRSATTGAGWAGGGAPRPWGEGDELVVRLELPGTGDGTGKLFAAVGRAPSGADESELLADGIPADAYFWAASLWKGDDTIELLSTS